MRDYDKLVYLAGLLPAFAWQSLTRSLPEGTIHIILALADHFEPAIDASDGRARAPYAEQQQRLDTWCREYPKTVNAWRDHDGLPFVHTYFYPAEQYDRTLIDRLADHCHSGWGEIEVHLHHGTEYADTAENTRRVLLDFRDALAYRHGCLSYEDDSDTPRYAFVHGNFALANSARGRNCGVDCEMQVLAKTGCYADMTLPTGPGHPAQTSKINSLYECALPLEQRAPHRSGRDLVCGTSPQITPLIIQGPLLPDLSRLPRRVGVENGSVTKLNPLSIGRLRLWKRAAIRVKGRPDWLFIKLHCHGMNPTQTDAVRGQAMQRFLRDLVEGADERREILHFVTAREMVNIILAACDGRQGCPGDYRNYRLKRRADASLSNPAFRQRSVLDR
jgi:hypothetical protein